MSNDETHAQSDPRPDEPGGTIAQTPDDLAQIAAALTPSDGPPTAVAPAVAVPGYQMVRKLGEGGMGAVYLFRDLKLNRDVAVKTLRANDARPEVVARFWAEAEVMAAVRHPHVVPVFELCKDSEHPFMIMEYLPNGPLSDRLKDGPLAPPAAAALLAKVASGVAAAHDLGIVHRDLKPGNVLLDAADEPKVADFGLAKRAANDLTRTQAVMGTPYYMAPELAAGRAKFVGPTADVWALGVMLYECVSGDRPFEADTTEGLLSQITTAEPVSLRARVRGLSRDLDTIAAKCLSKEPERRYPTAGELAADLGRFLRGEPIAARPVGAVGRAVRWARRKPTAAAAFGLGALAAALAAVAVVLLGFWQTADSAKRAAEEARGEAERARDARAEADSRARRSEERSNAILVAVLRGRFRDAVAAYDRAEADGLAITPAMRLDRVRALQATADAPRLRQEFAALDLDALPADVRGSFELWRAVSLFGTGEAGDAEAERLIRLALTRPLPPGDLEFARGCVAATTPEAVGHFLAAVRHDYLHQPARSAACCLLLVSGRLDEAIRLTEESAALFPDLPDFPIVLAAAFAYRGDEARCLQVVDRLSGRLPAATVDDMKVILPALVASVRLMRADIGYGRPDVADQVRVALAQQRAARYLGVVSPLGVPQNGLPPAQRRTLDTYIEAFAAIRAGRLFAGDMAEKYRERLAAATRTHPEGFLFLMQAMAEISWAFAVAADRPDEYARRLEHLIATLDRGAAAPAMFHVQDILADTAFMMRAGLTNRDVLGDRATPEATRRAVELLRDRARQWTELPTGFVLTPALGVCRLGREYDLARSILARWERERPDLFEPHRWRALIEHDAGAYYPALRAAERALELNPDDAEMKGVRAAARARLVPFEVAPPPRARP